MTGIVETSVLPGAYGYLVRRTIWEPPGPSEWRAGL